MKRQMLVLMAVVLVGGVPAGAQAGLVHRYSFDANANDLVGTAHGTLVNNTGNALYSGGQLRLGNDGSQSSGANNGDYVDLPNGIISALGNHATFEAWITWGGPSSSNWQRIFDFGTSTGGENVSNGGTYYVFLTPRNSTSSTYRGEYKDGSTVQYIHHTAALPVGVQQHVALVWDGTAGVARMYLNGQPVGSNTLHMTLSSIPDVNNWLGRSQFNDPLFTGSYNEFRIYDHAMTDAEVLASFQGGVHLQKGLVHRYSFNGNVNDSVGSAHGTLVDPNGVASYSGGVLSLGNTGSEPSNSHNPGGTPQGSYVDLPNSIISSLGTSATFEAWVVWNGTGGAWQRIFDFGRSDGGEGISDSGGSQKFIMITPKSSSSQMELHYRNGTSTTAITRPTMPANDKAHVAVVWDGQASVVRFYVNGALVGVNATNMALTDLIDVNNWLGRSQYGADPLFAGGYDEFRIYNKALSSFELGQSRLMGPEMPEANAKNAAYVADGGPVHYIPINLADAVGTSNINYNHPVLPSGQQTLGGVPFDIVNVNGNDSWNAYYATGSNRQLEIPINRGAITEANLLLGTFWGEQTAGTYASILFKATTGEEFVVQLDGNSDIRDYNQGSSANTINNITTTMVLQNGTQRVDMLKVILPDSWRWLTLESITIRDFGANGSGSDNFQRIFLSGLTLGTVPEPATVVLLALGGLALGGLAWRKNRRQEKVCS